MGRPKISVLLVEDDDGDAHRIEIMLKQAEDVRFEVRRAVSLKAAMIAVDALQPGLVLLDLSLPDYHGYDTVVEFARNTDVPFVVLTGNDDTVMAMRCVGRGAQDYVLKDDIAAKPLERAILKAIQRSLDQRASREFELASREVVLGDDEKATVSVLRPQISQLIEAVEDLENYVRKNAPNLLDDVRAILGKHEADVTIKALRDTLRLHADRRARKSGARPRLISDAAIKAVDSVIRKRGDVQSSIDADKDLLDIIRRRDSVKP